MRYLLILTYSAAVTSLAMPPLAMSAVPIAGAITSVPFGTLPDRTPVKLYILRSPQGMEPRITNYGGIVTALAAPDRRDQYITDIWNIDC